MSWDIELDDQLLQDLYAWVDQIPLSRPKRRIERDFSDGVMVAEVVKYYFPQWVELHNYTPANNTQQKMINWGLLNRKVFCRFGLNVPEHVMRGVCIGKTGLVENFLYNLRTKIDDFLYGMETNPSDPEYRNLNRKVKEKNTPRSTDKANSFNDYNNDFDVDDLSPRNLSKENLEEARLKFKNSMSISNKNQLIDNNNNTKKGVVSNNLNNEVVSKLSYEEKEQECLAKDEQIQILNAKIRRLEHLLHLKDIRIQDLCERLEMSHTKNGGANNAAKK